MVTTPPNTPELQGTGDPSWPEAALPPGSRESRRKAAGGPTGKSHPRTSGLAAFTPGTQPFQTDACGRRSTQRPEGVSTGARGAGLRVGKPGGRGAGTPAAGPASKCLPASRAAAPAAGGPLLPETRGAPRPCQDPDSPRGARTQCDLAGRETWRYGWILQQSAAVALSRLSCPGDPTQSS